jgi:hypothetical protein
MAETPQTNRPENKLAHSRAALRATLGAAGEMINLVSACIRKRMTAEDIALFQLGTHPAPTASPVVYHLVTAAETAICSMGQH